MGVTETLLIANPNKKSFKHYLSYGQSHGFGLNSGVSVLQTPLSNRIFMFNGGISPALNSKKTITSERIERFVPAFNGRFRESPVIAAAHYCLKQTDSNVLCTNHGSGGTKIEYLMRDSTQYQNMLSSIQRAREICASLDAQYALSPIMFFHGGANARDRRDEYKEKVRKLWHQMNVDIRKITGQTDDIEFIMQQNIAGETGLAQIELALEEPRIFRCQGPYYAQKFTDRFHLASSGYISLGAYNARASAVPDWLPLYPIHALIEGTKVILKFHNPSGTALLLDDKIVRNYKDGNFGFRWIDDTNSAKISRVSVAGADCVILELSNLPTGMKAHIGVADIAEGSAQLGLSKRCCLRDSSRDVDAVGMPMHNWACISRVPVTAKSASS